MFKFLLSLFFPHGLVTPFGVLPPSGGSDAALAGGSIVTSIPDVSPAQLITGDTSSLGSSAVRFNVGFKMTGKTGAFDIYSHDNFGILTAGRLSAQITGPLTLQVTIAPADVTSPVTLLSGWAAIMPTAPYGYGYPSTVSQISVLPGAVAITVTPLLTSTITIPLPPGIRTDVLIRQVVGSNPILVYGFETANIAHAHVVLSGTVNLSGIGYWGGFFPAAA